MVTPWPGGQERADPSVGTADYSIDPRTGQVVRPGGRPARYEIFSTDWPGGVRPVDSSFVIAGPLYPVLPQPVEFDESPRPTSTVAVRSTTVGTRAPIAGPEPVTFRPRSTTTPATGVPSSPTGPGRPVVSTERPAAESAPWLTGPIGPVIHVGWLLALLHRLSLFRLF